MLIVDILLASVGVLLAIGFVLAIYVSALIARPIEARNMRVTVLSGENEGASRKLDHQASRSIHKPAIESDVNYSAAPSPKTGC
ncbi:hypothetical protein [Bradyrhizobium sp. ORS 86]|uniref:hypothetical protein n=1 Tax=Bradyrhizobium sp. ORS 86 TaxID=1685970 RepID=UPI00388D91FA